MATEEQESEEVEETETPAEERSRKYWWLSLAFIFLFLAGGGYYALSTMGTAAHKLAGGENYSQLSANSAVYSGKGALQKSDNYFSADEPEAAAAADGAKAAGASGAAAAEAAKLKAADKKLAASDGASGGAVSASVQEQEEEGKQPEGASGMAALAAGTFSGKLEARASGLPGHRGAQASATTSHREVAAFEGSGPAAGKPAMQSETARAGAPKKGGAGGVIDALKGAFRASFYGARIASHDSARSWIAKTFDATPEYNTAIEYDEKMRAKLDRIDPNSIPKFLREQDVSAAEAKTLASSDVGKPSVDVEGTKEALKNDKDYQSKKMAADLAKGAVNPMGNLFKGGDTGGGEESPGANTSKGVMDFASPEDEAAFQSVALTEFVEVTGASEEDYGKECGCTKTAPCCCLPQNTVTSSCPKYGPFLPDDPCGAAIYGPIGDFPPVNTDVMPA
jgi:hypothetical protein